MRSVTLQNNNNGSADVAAPLSALNNVTVREALIAKLDPGDEKIGFAGLTFLLNRKFEENRGVYI